jgi:hypothetical protein
MGKNITGELTAPILRIKIWKFYFEFGFAIEEYQDFSALEKGIEKFYSKGGEKNEVNKSSHTTG